MDNKRRSTTGEFVFGIMLPMYGSLKRSEFRALSSMIERDPGNVFRDPINFYQKTIIA
jgi:hypothetical protein